MTQQGQADTSSTWVPNSNPDANGNTGVSSRRDSSDISAPSGSAVPHVVNGHAAHPAATSSGGDVNVSPFHLTPKTEDATTNGSSSGPSGNNVSASADRLPSSEVKVEASSSDQAAFTGSQTATYHPAAGPGPSTAAHAAKRQHSTLLMNPLKRRKLDAAHYSEVEKTTYYAREAQLALALEIDQQITLDPPLDTFSSHMDAVHRLLPWHVWQTHDSELDLPDRHDAKSKAKEEVAEREASALVKRVKGVRERWEKMRRQYDQRPAQHAETLIPVLTDIQSEQRELNHVYRETHLTPINNRYNELLARDQARAEAARKAQEARLAAQRQAEAAAQAKERARLAEIEARRKAERERAEKERQERERKEREAQEKARKEREKQEKAKRDKEERERKLAQNAPSTPQSGPSGVQPSTAAVTSESLTPASTSSVPSTPSDPGTPTRGRGRGRGRPRGSRGAGMRQAVVTHQAHAQAQSQATQSTPVPMINGVPMTSPSPSPTPSPSPYGATGPIRPPSGPSTPSKAGPSSTPVQPSNRPAPGPAGPIIPVVTPPPADALSAAVQAQASRPSRMRSLKDFKLPGQRQSPTPAPPTPSSTQVTPSDTQVTAFPVTPTSWTGIGIVPPNREPGAPPHVYDPEGYKKAPVRIRADATLIQKLRDLKVLPPHDEYSKPDPVSGTKAVPSAEVLASYPGHIVDMNANGIAIIHLWLLKCTSVSLKDIAAVLNVDLAKATSQITSQARPPTPAAASATTASTPASAPSPAPPKPISAPTAPPSQPAPQPSSGVTPVRAARPPPPAQTRPQPPPSQPIPSASTAPPKPVAKSTGPAQPFNPTPTISDSVTFHFDSWCVEVADHARLNPMYATMAASAGKIITANTQKNFPGDYARGMRVVVKYDTPATAQKAIKELDGKQIEGHRMAVRAATAQEVRDILSGGPAAMAAAAAAIEGNELPPASAASQAPSQSPAPAPASVAASVPTSAQASAQVPLRVPAPALAPTPLPAQASAPSPAPVPARDPAPVPPRLPAPAPTPAPPLSQSPAPPSTSIPARDPAPVPTRASTPAIAATPPSAPTSAPASVSVPARDPAPIAPRAPTSTSTSTPPSVQASAPSSVPTATPAPAPIPPRAPASAVAAAPPSSQASAPPSVPTPAPAPAQPPAGTQAQTAVTTQPQAPAMQENSTQAATASTEPQSSSSFAGKLPPPGFVQTLGRRTSTP